MTAALAAGLLGALAGGVAGVVAHRYLRTRRYRYPDEADLPVRDTRWVLLVTPLATGLVAAGHVPHRPALGVLLAASVPVLAVLSAIDLDTRRLPDRWVFPSAATALVGIAAVSVVEGTASPLVAGAVAGVALGGFYLVNVVIGEMVGSGGGMGLGDAKLAVPLGLVLGPLSAAHVVVATVLAFVAAGVQGGWMVLVRRSGRGSHLAFGPHLAGAAVAVLAAPGVAALVGAAP
ncbi:A24 family peptidase [Phycicoccus jejuensis]|uniref:prepilin peptidase n=1 Tax=Phycicoccus jejuensis TaxID=367299 RepID=UPI0004C3D5AB|nr:A24 family peptidase [Phycicoccus jejuensis]